MARKLLKFTLIATIVAAAANVALAGGLPGPFEFRFFTDDMTEAVLYALQLAGCA